MSWDGSTWRNWAGNQTCSPARYHKPTSRQEIVDLVRDVNGSGKKLRVVGGGHSWSALACSEDNLVNLDDYSQIIEIDPQSLSVTVQGGIRLHRLNRFLASNGLALSNLGTIDKQSLAGAISTGTHGTGIQHGILATQILAIELITGTGKVINCSREENRAIFMAALCGLGCVGIISTIRVQCRKAFHLHTVERKTSLSYVVRNLAELIYRNDFFKFYWMPYTDTCLLLIQNETDASVNRAKLPTLVDQYIAKNFAFDAICRLSARFDSYIPTFNRLATELAAHRKDYVDKSFEALCVPVHIRHWESEYAIPVERTIEAIQDLKRCIELQKKRVNMFLEFRFVKGDDIWLSPAFMRDSCFIDAFQYRSLPFDDYFRALDELFTSYSGRPHWGKISYMDSHIYRSLYPKWKEFLGVRERVDPGRVLSNAYTERLFGPVNVN